MNRMTIIRKGDTGEPTTNAGHFGSKTHTAAEATLEHSHAQPGAYQDVTRNDWLGRTYDVEVNAATGLTDEEFQMADDSCAEALLWSGTDDVGKPLDFDRSIHDLPAETRQKLAADLHAFIAQNRPLVDQALNNKDYGAASGDGTGAYGQLGHDFVLSRTGSGSGFWDRGELSGELGRELAAAAQQFADIDAYVGDDGRVYL